MRLSKINGLPGAPGQSELMSGNGKMPNFGKSDKPPGAPGAPGAPEVEMLGTRL
jgi:hypothetical protein